MSGNGIEPIAVYLVSRHPLDYTHDMHPLRWLQTDNGFIHELRGFIGPFDPHQLSLLVDEAPAGSAWSQLLEGLLSGKIQTVVTHLAPLTSGQRQQLIGVCDCTRTKLVTPGDGGRNSILLQTNS
jgi:hypothetical protein